MSGTRTYSIFTGYKTSSTKWIISFFNSMQTKCALNANFIFCSWNLYLSNSFLNNYSMIIIINIKI